MKAVSFCKTLLHLLLSIDRPRISSTYCSYACTSNTTHTLILNQKKTIFI